MDISFEDTKKAFAYKSDAALKKAKWLFASMNIGWLVKLGTKLTPWAIKAKLPVNGLLKQTLFSQFVGGETLDETKAVADKLNAFNVQVILDYGVEGKEGEDSFEHATDEFIKVIRYASTQKNIPFISIKLTGFARFKLLEKSDEAAATQDTVEGKIDVSILNIDERHEFSRVRERLVKICQVAADTDIGVLIDAEETWIQDPVDALAMEMMLLYNKEKAVVYNTIQLYRHDRLNFLKQSFAFAEAHGIILGVKLVRGAYMEKERTRATALGYPSPIQPNKAASDKDYNASIKFCIDHLENIMLIVASHNEQSSLYTTELLKEKYGEVCHRHVHFSQLFGMSDNITFNLAASGCSVSKYLPFGPVEDVVPYLMRRAQENSSISGHTGRELGLIKKEVRRRKLEK